MEIQQNKYESRPEALKTGGVGLQGTAVGIGSPQKSTSVTKEIAQTKTDKAQTGEQETKLQPPIVEQWEKTLLTRLFNFGKTNIQAPAVVALKKLKEQIKLQNEILNTPFNEVDSMKKLKKVSKSDKVHDALDRLISVADGLYENREPLHSAFRRLADKWKTLHPIAPAHESNTDNTDKGTKKRQKVLAPPKTD